MKRFTKNSFQILIPKLEKVVVEESTVFGERLSGNSARKFLPMGCMNCPDTPCMTWDEEIISRQTRVESVADLDLKVCPTDSMKMGVGGRPEIDETCFGCGLCVVRCPIHAISLDQENCVARVNTPPTSFEKFTGTLEEFYELRMTLGEHFKFSDLGSIHTQYLQKVISKVGDLKTSGTGWRALRLLIRNAFLIQGATARLSIIGDNNNWAELVVDDGVDLFAIEIEVGVDGLDSARRVTSDVAIAVGRYGIEIGDIKPVVVISQLPNIRSDYYSVVSDTRNRLEVNIYTVPIVLIIWSIINPEFNLVATVTDSCLIDLDVVKECSLPETVGLPRDHPGAVVLGLAPQK